jgi:small redox-active disulfide protein 2
MKLIQILGSGCAKCNMLADNARKAAEELGIEFHLDKITNINTITAMGVLITPGLAVDGEVKASGKLLSVEEIKQILS